MKNIITMAACLCSLIVYSQVGINTKNPQASLDITAKTTDGSMPEGLIAPRLTGNQIQAGDAHYGTAQKGAIIYVTAAATAPSAKTTNITAEGYYYFDGKEWQKFSSTAVVQPVTPKLMLSVSRSTDFTGTAGAVNVIPWNSENYDIENVFVPGNTAYIVQKTGIHQIFVNATVDGAGFAVGSAWYLRILKNGTPVAAIDATKAAGASAVVFSIDNFNAGDLISVDFGTKPNIAMANLTKLNVFRFE